MGGDRQITKAAFHLSLLLSVHSGWASLYGDSLRFSPSYCKGFVSSYVVCSNIDASCNLNQLLAALIIILAFSAPELLQLNVR